MINDERFYQDCHTVLKEIVYARPKALYRRELDERLPEIARAQMSRCLRRLEINGKIKRYCGMYHATASGEALIDGVQTANH